MKKKILIMAMIAAMSVTALAGCGSDADTSSDTTTSNVTIQHHLILLSMMKHSHSFKTSIQTLLNCIQQLQTL